MLCEFLPPGYFKVSHQSFLRHLHLFLHSPRWNSLTDSRRDFPTTIAILHHQDTLPAWQLYKLGLQNPAGTDNKKILQVTSSNNPIT